MKLNVTVLENMYTEATARVHTENQVPEKIPIMRDVSQEDQISPKSFTSTIHLGFAVDV